MEMSGALTKVLPRQCGGNTWGLLLYIGKKGSEIVKRKQAVGFTYEQSLQGGAFSRDLLDQKSKSPLFPGPCGGGGGRGYK